MAILNNNPLIGASGNQGGYNINNSLRFRSSASAYLNRTPASAGNLQTWTWSGWVKLGALSADRTLFGAASSGNAQLANIHIAAANSFEIDILDANSTRTIRGTTAVFRDPSAWYHVVFALDTTQATAANRMKLYVNGTQISLDVAAVGTYPAQNANCIVNSTSGVHNIGRRPQSNDRYFDGYLAEVNFIDGSAKTPSDFGETDTTTGVWKPKAYSGTYGTNGFYLKFSDIATTSGSNAGLGKDFSGNTNYWTTNNISVTSGTTYDAMIDSPTNASASGTRPVGNYCVLNPLWNGNNSPGTFSYANLRVGQQGTSSYNNSASTIAVPATGYWYAEFTMSANVPYGGGNNVNVGIISALRNSLTTSQYIGGTSDSYGYFDRGQFYNNGSASQTAATYATNDVISIALGNGKLWWAKNGVWQGTGSPDPATATSPAYSGLTGDWYMGVMTFSSPYGGTIDANFGQRPFAYTPPTGFQALCTTNLPDSTIVKGNSYMDATLYTGTGSSLSVTNAGAFKPDLIWIKERNATGWNIFTDSVRGLTKNIYSNSTNAEATNNGTDITAINTNGFSLGADTGGDGVNRNGNTVVAWQWQAGQGSTSSNTSGSITSTVSVNTTAGFSIVTYTGTGVAGTVGHGLGVAPKMIIIKGRNYVDNWYVYNSSIGNTNFLLLNTTAASAVDAKWNNTSPTSTVFSLNGAGYGINGSTNTYVAYCFAEIAGFSRFGSYTGNGSTDGPFVYTGFRPKWIMVKSSSYSAADTHWHMLDTSRNTANPEDKYLNANTSGAEDTYTFFDILSNGFKLRQNGASFNGSGTTYIYMAFAESPFKNSLAR